MKKNRRSAIEFETIKARHYAVICTAKPQLPAHPVTISYLMERLQKTWNDLKRHIAGWEHTEIVVEEIPNIVLKLVVPTKAQGALMAVATHGLPNNLAPSDSELNDARNTKISTHPLLESAMAEAEALSKFLSKQAKGAIDIAQKIIEQAESESLSIEQATPAFSASPNETISRRVYCRSRDQEQIVSFLGDDWVLGGGHTVSNYLNSQATFSLTNCKVRRMGNSKNQYLIAGENDSEWQRLIDWSGGAIDEIEGDDASNEIFLLRSAEITNQSVDIDVCVGEKVSMKRRKLVPLNIRNQSAILASLKERIELIESQ